MSSAGDVSLLLSGNTEGLILTEMTTRERFQALMNFQPFDRLPIVEWAGWWDQTITRWHSESLPVQVVDRYDVCRHFGLDIYYQGHIPVTKPGCPSPQAHGAGIVETEDDYERIRECLYPWPVVDLDQWKHWVEEQARGDVVLWFTLNGFFWFPRTLLGIQNHFYAFYDHPALMHRMNQDLVDHQSQALQRMAKLCCPVFMTFGEDCSYNHGPMLSKKLFDEFMAPYYCQVVPLLQELNIVPFIDSDGDITEMVPWFAEVGVNGFAPLERQAGVDGNALRRRFPKLQIIGHFDKMTMPLGEDAMRAEFERLLPLMRTGGYIPSVDHQTPPGVSLENYRIYLRLLEEYAAKGAP